ncbi:hypothetical protein SALBM217S_07376 [Streptomyces griseoloalbus]
MRAIRILSAALLTLGLAAAPAAADSSPSPEASGDSGGPTRAGTSFRTATEVEQGQTATARASTGDYLYWSFPADAGQRPAVRATVKLPEGHAAETWQVDVYDGLRRRQACQYGAQTRAAGPGTASVELACVLRTVRAWSEPWADDPLPGTYYVRLTALKLSGGRPGPARRRRTARRVRGHGRRCRRVDGSLTEPLVPGIGLPAGGGGRRRLAVGRAGRSGARSRLDAPAGGPTRWVWTAAGGPAALAGVCGRRRRRARGRRNSTGRSFGEVACPAV